MTWTQGHIWKTSIVFDKINSYFFYYKYAVKQADGKYVWEQGCNRIADLKLLKQ